VRLTFRVAGVPVPKGSKRVVPIRRGGALIRHAAIEAPKVKQWETIVRETAHDAAVRAGLTEPSNAPVEVEITFWIQRPQGHYRTGTHSDQLRPSAPIHPATKPDVDKLARAILDAITGILITDDSRVIRIAARKVYGWPPAADITIHALRP
jgi:Holliday junction resolvase RusA-like endonuclease